MAWRVLCGLGIIGAVVTGVTGSGAAWGSASRAAADGDARFWPVGDRPAVVRPWAPPATPYGPGHRGVDLSAPIGAPVRSVAAGRVSFAGEVAGRGVVTVELTSTGDPPLRTTYEPVTATVEKGAHLAPGDPLGTLQLPTGHCPPAAPSCLHWGLLRGAVYLDPLSLLDPSLLHGAPARLLPVWGRGMDGAPAGASLWDVNQATGGRTWLWDGTRAIGGTGPWDGTRAIGGSGLWGETGVIGGTGLWTGTRTTGDTGLWGGTRAIGGAGPWGRTHATGDTGLPGPDRGIAETWPQGPSEGR